MSRPRDLFLPPIALDRQSSLPLHQQLVDQISHAIRFGAQQGSRLPSSRVLAQLIGVSRNTVMTAYDELVATGLIQGRRGAGMLVTSSERGGPLLNLSRLLRRAQYPARTVHILDPDGSHVYLAFR